MASGKMIQVEGEVVEVLPDRRYRISLDNDEVVLATVAGRARRGLWKPRETRIDDNDGGETAGERTRGRE